MIELAACVILDTRGWPLMMHRNTLGWPGVPQFCHWEMLGGKIEAGETPEQAAIREAWEEAGVRVRIIRPLGAARFRDSSGDYHDIWYLAKIAAGQPEPREGKFDDCAHIDLFGIDPAELSAGSATLRREVEVGRIVWPAVI